MGILMDNFQNGIQNKSSIQKWGLFSFRVFLDRPTVGISNMPFYTGGRDIHNKSCSRELKNLIYNHFFC